jgi:molecular chaperone GrpE (heat shock protein)
MRHPTEPKLAKWPFILGDIALVGVACFIYAQSTVPMALWQVAFVVVCVAGGACLAIMPFLLEYRLAARLAEANALGSVVAQIQRLEEVAAQIAGATSRWQNVQEESEKTAAAAKTIAERMTAEVKAFAEFMQRMNDSEKSTLKLEAEKLRRAEGDWLQVLVRMLDHVYALHNGAVRSGQPNLIEQLGNFQNACRDAARRVGLTPFLATPSEPFDAQKHQLLDGNGAPPAGATVADTVATGYTFQGRLLRPAIVRLANGAQEQAPAATMGGTPGATAGQ